MFFANLTLLSVLIILHLRCIGLRIKEGFNVGSAARLVNVGLGAYSTLRADSFETYKITKQMDTARAFTVVSNPVERLLKSFRPLASRIYTQQMAHALYPSDTLIPL